MRLMSILVLMVTIFGASTSFAANVDVSQKDKSLAQYEVDRWKKQVVRSDKYYKDKLLNLNKNKGVYFVNRVRGLRSMYPFTSFYTPFSDRLVDKMSEYAYAVDTSNDPAVINENLQEYRKILNLHLVNVGVLDFAITMARVNAKFGSARYYESVRDIMIDGLMTPEIDGKSPSKAFNIVTKSEEIHLLAKIGGEIGKSEMYDVEGTYFNVYDVTLENGDFTQIFMNVTDPIKKTYIKQHLEEKEDTYTLPGMQ